VAGCHPGIAAGAGDMMAVALSFAVLAAFALIGVGAWGVVRAKGERLKPALMIGAGIVVLLNVWLYAAPLPGA